MYTWVREETSGSGFSMITPVNHSNSWSDDIVFAVFHDYLKMAQSMQVLIRIMAIYNVDVVSYNQLSP